MIVCKDCKEESTIEQSENDRAFPAYAVAGGLIGAAGTLVTGTLLLMPMAVVAGALTDVLGRQCGVCGDEIEEGESAYSLMEELDDGVGGRSYRCAGNSQEPVSPNLQKHSVSSRPEGSQSDKETPGWSRTSGDRSLVESHDPPLQDRLVFDQVEGRLMQAEPLPGEGAIDPNLPDGFDNHACVDFGAQGLSGLEQGQWDPGLEEFSFFHDDVEADIDPLGPIDETQIEGV